MYPPNPPTGKGHETSPSGTCSCKPSVPTSNGASPSCTARGHDRVTLAHTTLLPYLDPEGTSVTNLAERAGMTKQSMRQLVVDLEDKGYIKRTPDPDDRRATLVIFTAEGRRFIEDGYEAKKEIDDEYRALLGEKRLEALKGSLKTLIEKTGEDGRLA